MPPRPPTLDKKTVSPPGDTVFFCGSQRAAHWASMSASQAFMAWRVRSSRSLSSQPRSWAPWVMVSREQPAANFLSLNFLRRLDFHFQPQLTHHRLHDLTHLDAVLLRVALEVQVVQQPRLGPERRLLPVTQLPGEPVHDGLHRQGMAQVKGLLVILPEQGQRLLPCQLHGPTPP